MSRAPKQHSQNKCFGNLQLDVHTPCVNLNHPPYKECEILHDLRVEHQGDPDFGQKHTLLFSAMLVGHEETYSWKSSAMHLVRSPLHLLLFFSNLAVACAATDRIPNSTTSSPSSSSCPSYRCGHTVDIRYPFWIDDGAGNASSSSSWSTHCGYPSLRLECRRETPVLPLPSGDYAVTHIMYGDRTVSLFDLAVFSLSHTCPLLGRNLSLPAGSTLSLTARDANLTFFLHCSFVGIPAHLVACLEGDGRHHSYVFRDGDELAPSYGYAARMCQDVIGMPVLRRSLLVGAAGSGSSSSSSSPLDAVVPALNMGFELSWTPEVDGECGQCERAGGLCGRRRQEVHGAPWTFACFRAAANPAWIPPKTPEKSSIWTGQILLLIFAFISRAFCLTI